ncbi:MAG: two-component sensor histidine kinase [Rothia mucilaginosa]|uniref:sensor histidine kinase n=1 Tax=Rothia mucilaginosa TaxID=43675 RepID=UPI001DA60E6F|nr:histidine kinase [Rothia mucilaginosa]MBS6433593.1 two-component sensor histidine kinase [Rothia mucilaginosa]
MTETHPHNTDQARAVNGLTSAENEAAPSAAKRTLGKHRFRFLYRERRGSVNWLALGFSAPWLVFLLMPLDSFLTAPELEPVRWTGVALIALFAVINCSAYAVPWLVPVASTVRRSIIWTVLMALPVAGLTALRLESAYVVFLAFNMYFVAFWIFGTIAPYRLRLGVAATIALVCWLIFMVGTGFDVTAHGGISLFIGAPMVGILGFSYLIELGERADVARASLALSEEREEIARDVHDVLGHSLTVITLKAELAQRLLEIDPARAGAEMEAIAQLSRASLAEVRSTVTRLRVPDFSGEIEGAGRALQTAGIRAELPEAQSALAVAGVNAKLFSWVLREAVTNMVRHSDANAARVRLSVTGLDILDNGVGVGDARGNGLTGMAQRVAASGGSVVIEAAPEQWLAENPNPAGGVGTRIRVSMDGDTSQL